MTWNELVRWISTLPGEWKESDVTVYLKETDEYFPLDGLGEERETDTLDKGHPFLIIDA